MPDKASLASLPSLSSHDRILMAGKHLFAHNGYENTSTVAISREAGTSESQMMKHFGSKQGLLTAIFDRGWVAIAERIQAAVKKAGVVAKPILIPGAKHGIEDNWGPGVRQPRTFPPNAQHPEFLEDALRSGEQGEPSWQAKLAEHVPAWEPARFG